MTSNLNYGRNLCLSAVYGNDSVPFVNMQSEKERLGDKNEMFRKRLL